MAELDTLPFDELESFVCKCGSLLFTPLRHIEFIVSKQRIDPAGGAVERKRRIVEPPRDEGAMTVQCVNCHLVHKYDSTLKKFVEQGQPDHFQGKPT